MAKNSFGKNNFDQLEAAGLVSDSNSEDVEQKQRIVARVSDLTNLHSKLVKLKSAALNLHLMQKSDQLKTLKIMATACHRLLAEKPPIGSKRPLVKCVNELTSLREGVFTGAACDKAALSLIACGDAIEEIERLRSGAQARLEKVSAADTDYLNSDEYSDSIQKTLKSVEREADKLAPIKDKRFIIARVPVIPTGTALSVEALRHNGFKADSLDMYPVIHNQIVVGINPSKLGVKNTSKRDASHHAIMDAVEDIRKKIAKTKNERVFLVLDTPFKYKSGSWFWLMTERDLRMFAKCFPSKHVSVDQWGFAFN